MIAVTKIMIVADIQEIYNEFYNEVGRCQVNVGVQLGTTGLLPV